MKEIFVLRELEQLRAISHPYRVEVLESFSHEEPRSAKQIAEKLGEPHAKVNYHIKNLLNVGILNLVEERVKSGIIEKYYLPAARVIVIDRNFLNNTDEDVIRSLNQVSVSIFEKISTDFYRAVENQVAKTKYIRHHNDSYLTDDEARELMKSVDAHITDYLENKKDEEREGVHPYNIVALGIPIVKINRLNKLVEE
ncbi:MAG: helix-turn-helix domain-containing protein [Clostridiales bacterium]|nr:helix-turn-helix domain-containing protein [Clostridiales bacterium]